MVMQEQMHCSRMLPQQNNIQLILLRHGMHLYLLLVLILGILPQLVEELPHAVLAGRLGPQGGCRG